MKRMRYILLTVAVGALCFEFGYLASPGGREAAPAMQMQAVQEDPMSTFRRERQQLRAMQRAQLNEIIYDTATEGGLRSAAQRQLMELAAAEEAETNIEGMIRMRGWEDCVATVQAGAVNVLVRAELITRQESSVILDLVCRETGVQAGNVKIIPVNSAK